MSEKHDFVYFQPRQLLFHVESNQPVPIDALVKWANDLLVSKDKDVMLTPGELIRFNQEEGPYLKKGRLLSSNQTPEVSTGGEPKPTVPHQPLYQSPEVKMPPPFSFVFADAKSDRWPEFPVVDDPDPQQDRVLDLNPQEMEQQISVLKELLDIAVFLDKERRTAPVKLQVVSLNWLFSNSRDSQPGGTGGPGGRPSPAQYADINKSRIKLPSTITWPQAFSSVSQPDGGKDVVVAILDTAYSEVQRNDIIDKWVTKKSPKDQHPLVKSLLAPGGCLNFEYDRTVDTYMKGITIYGHDYDMTDHGLFVAGIIHSLAPQAELYLYQVLNKFGLGDLRSIGTALNKVINAHGNRQLVVNLSLNMNMPLESGHLSGSDNFGMGQFILDHRPSFLMRAICWVVCWIFSLLHLPCPGFCESWYDRQARPFEWICDSIYALNSRVVAAAGNNAKGKGRRPGAMFPAAFERVFGVGALPRGVSPTATNPVKAASYSNLADWPPRKGITTLGGEEGDQKGILGVYVGPFPNGQSNDYGWAWWCGTSFATPIISGITAAVLANLNSTGRRFSTEAAIAELYKAQLPTTGYLEEVFVVEQS